MAIQETSGTYEDVRFVLAAIERARLPRGGNADETFVMFKNVAFWTRFHHCSLMGCPPSGYSDYSIHKAPETRSKIQTIS